MSRVLPSSALWAAEIPGRGVDAWTTFGTVLE